MAAAKSVFMDGKREGKIYIFLIRNFKVLCFFLFKKINCIYSIYIYIYGIYMLFVYICLFLYFICFVLFCLLLNNNIIDCMQKQKFINLLIVKYIVYRIWDFDNFLYGIVVALGFILVLLLVYFLFCFHLY